MWSSAKGTPVAERIGVFGGSFDPPHIGHQALAEAACAQLGLDRLILVPCARSPHKDSGPSLPADLRIAMVEAMAAEDARMEVSRIEIDRPPPSYTVDTLAAIAAEYPGAALWLVIGADQLPAFPRWHQTDRILTLCRLAVAGRPGVDGATLEEAGAAIGPEHLDLITMEPQPVSSTEVRHALAEGRDPGPMLPPAVTALLPRP